MSTTETSNRSLTLLSVITELMGEGLSDDQIARDLSSYGKADLIGALREVIFENVDVEGVTSLMESASVHQVERILDQKRQKDLSDGDFLVVQKEMHEQAYRVEAGLADSCEEAARHYRNEGPPRHGTSTYIRLLENEDLRVRRVTAPADPASPDGGKDQEALVDPGDL